VISSKNENLNLNSSRFYLRYFANCPNEERDKFFVINVCPDSVEKFASEEAQIDYAKLAIFFANEIVNNCTNKLNVFDLRMAKYTFKSELNPEQLDQDKIAALFNDFQLDEDFQLKFPTEHCTLTRLDCEVEGLTQPEISTEIAKLVQVVRAKFDPSNFLTHSESFGVSYTDVHIRNMKQRRQGVMGGINLSIYHKMRFIKKPQLAFKKIQQLSQFSLSNVYSNGMFYPVFKNLLKDKNFINDLYNIPIDFADFVSMIAQIDCQKMKNFLTSLIEPLLYSAKTKIHIFSVVNKLKKFATSHQRALMNNEALTRIMKYFFVCGGQIALKLTKIRLKNRQFACLFQGKSSLNFRELLIIYFLTEWMHDFICYIHKHYNVATFESLNQLLIILSTECVPWSLESIEQFVRTVNRALNIEALRQNFTLDYSFDAMNSNALFLNPSLKSRHFNDFHLFCLIRFIKQLLHNQREREIAILNMHIVDGDRNACCIEEFSNMQQSISNFKFYSINYTDELNTYLALNRLNEAGFMIDHLFIKNLNGKKEFLFELFHF